MNANPYLRAQWYRNSVRTPKLIHHDQKCTGASYQQDCKALQFKVPVTVAHNVALRQPNIKVKGKVSHVRLDDAVPSP